MTKPADDEIENIIATLDRYFNNEIKYDIPLVIQQYIPRLIKYIRVQEQLITSAKKEVAESIFKDIEEMGDEQDVELYNHIPLYWDDYQELRKKYLTEGIGKEGE